MIGLGTGTRFSSFVDAFVLYLCRASNILYSRSTWCAVFEMSDPAGFFLRTKRVLFASVKKYVGFDLKNIISPEDDSMHL